MRSACRASLPSGSYPAPWAIRIAGRYSSRVTGAASIKISRRSASRRLPRRASGLSPADGAERPAGGPDAAALPAVAPGQGRRGRLVSGDDLGARQAAPSRPEHGHGAREPRRLGRACQAHRVDRRRAGGLRRADGRGRGALRRAFEALIDERRRLGKVVADLSAEFPDRAFANGGHGPARPAVWKSHSTEPSSRRVNALRRSPGRGSRATRRPASARVRLRRPPEACSARKAETLPRSTLGGRS